MDVGAVDDDLSRRVEVVFPVEDHTLVSHLRDNVLALYLEDTLNAHVLQSDGTYRDVDGKTCDSQAWFIEHSL